MRLPWEAEPLESVLGFTRTSLAEAFFGGDMGMAVPRAFIRVASFLVLPAIVGSIPLATVAGSGGGRAELADMLRHGPGVSNHPVGVVPSAAIGIPTGWPLDADGAMTCMTCHSRLPALDGSPGPQLRMNAAGGQFCAACHQAEGERSAASAHWMAVQRAHIRDDETDGNGVRSGGLLDSDSRRCLACHDGVSASESAHATRWNRGPGDVGDPRRNHPVGVAYPARSQRERGGPFRAAGLLPKQIRLCEGKVSCVSCHDLYSDRPYRLAVPVERSALCLSCHEL